MRDVPNIDIRPDHWAIVSDILQKNVPQHEVWAFGSRAKWTAKEYSDLDLAIITDQPLSLQISASLSDDFSESDLPWKVDVVDWAATKEGFKQIIQGDRVVVKKEYAKDQVMAAEWIEMELGRFIELKRGYDLPKNDREQGTVPLVSSAGETDFHSVHKVKGPGVVTGRYGTIGKVFYVAKDFWPLNTTLYVKDFKGNDPLFVYYLLQTIRYSDYIDKAAVPGVNRNHLHKAEICVPVDHIRQRNLVTVLWNLDEKIELNRQTNQTLEQIAQAIFKSWFVDFEPTRAKIAAKEAGATAEEIERSAMCAISGKSVEELAQLSAESQQQLKTTAGLFPDALVESELGEIPVGWEVKGVGNYLSTISKTYPLKSVSEVIFLNTGDIQNGKFLHSNRVSVETLPGQAKKSIQKHDILFSEIRPENKRFAYVYFDALDHVVSTKLMVLRAAKGIPSIFLYFLITQQSTTDYLQILAESRSGTFPQITFNTLSKVEFIGPIANFLVDEFVKTILKPTFQAQQIANHENDCLIELRDALLPKLLSGEINLTQPQPLPNHASP